MWGATQKGAAVKKPGRSVGVIAVMLTLAVPAFAQWKYEVVEDKMSGEKTTLAQVWSEESLDLPFPYKGKNPGVLTVRKHAKHGLDVMFSVSKGQLMCNNYSGCSLTIRFDDKKPMTFKGSGPSDRSSTMIFLGNTKKFLDEAKSAKRILVQAEFFQAGAHVLTFNAPQGLAWPPKQ